MAVCQTTDPPLADAPCNTRITEVRVDAMPGVGFGLRMVNGKTPQRANLALEQGRVLMGSDSTITGTPRLEEIKTGRLIAQPRVLPELAGM